MSDYKSDRSKHADTIIRNHVIWSMGAGLIPVLIADIFAVSALQLDMIRQMAKVYEVDFQEQQGKAIVTSLTSSTLARLGAGSIVKMIPVFGTYLGGATVSVFAGASTYALGEVFKKHFESGGTILDFDPDRLRKLYKEKFEKGKKMAKEMKKTQEDTGEDVPEPTGGFSSPRKAEEGEPATPTSSDDTPTAEPMTDGGSTDVISRLKELGELKDAGVISEEEFAIMKKKLIEEF